MKYSLRNLLKFSIRDLLWLTVVVALAVAWSLDRSRLREETRAVEAKRGLLEEMIAKDRSRLREEARADAAERGLLEEMVTTAKARAKFEATIAQAQAAAVKAQAEFESAVKKSQFDGAMQAADEGPVQGYKLLGPPPPTRP